MTLRTKIAGLSVLGIALTAVSLVGVTLLNRGPLFNQVAHEVDKLGREQCATVAKDVRQMAQVLYDYSMVKLHGDLAVAESTLKQTGPVRFDETDPVTWNAVNQFTKQAERVDLPRMMVGDTWLGQNTDPSVTSPIVDHVEDLVGGTATIFQRMNPQGDMLRVCTNVTKLDGERAVGTFIPATNPDGTPNKVVQTVLKGETFFGRAFVVNAWYLTAYAPIFDQDRNVVGVNYVGVEQEKIKALRNGIMDITVGKTGYVFVLGGSGKDQGRYIISQGGQRDGEVILDAKDANGNPFIKEMVEKATADPGNVVYQDYAWKNPGDDQARDKVTAAIYFEPWDWVIGAGAYKADFEDALTEVDSAISAMVLWSLLAGTILLIAAGAVAVFVAKGIAKPIENVSKSLRDIAQGDGDLTQRLALAAQNCSEINKCGNKQCAAYGKQVKCWEIAGSDAPSKEQMTCLKLTKGEYDNCHQCPVMKRSKGDEITEMSSWFNTFISDVHRMISSLTKSASEVASAAAEIAASNEELSAGMTEQNTQLMQITSAVEQMKGSVDEVAQQSIKASEQADASGELAQQGGQVVGQTIEQIQNIATLVSDSAKAMDELGERSQQIGQVIEVINDIADQTNLLALNAAIEAARAGEHGRGFAVVADEVRKLADRTTKATEQIGQSIGAIQQETDQAVRRMNGGTEQVNVGVGRAKEAGESLEHIVEAAQNVAGGIRGIASATEQQSAAAQQISESIEAIASVTQQANEGTNQAAQAAAQLSHQAEELQNLVKRFKIGG